MLFDHKGLLQIAHVNSILQVYIAPPLPPQHDPFSVL